MTTQHTPGPWNVNKKVETSVEQSAAGQGINLICQTEDPDGIRTKEEEKANARLIAAAPELLDALIKAKAYVQDCLDTCNQIANEKDIDDGPEAKACMTLIDEIEAAIAKATGI